MGTPGDAPAGADVGEDGSGGIVVNSPTREQHQLGVVENLLSTPNPGSPCEQQSQCLTPVPQLHHKEEARSLCQPQ